MYAMGRGMSVKKRKGYGRILSKARINYLKKKGKSSMAFTSRGNKKYFEKVGFKTHDTIIKRFRWKHPKTGKILKDFNGVGVYYDGKDKLISKMLKSKGAIIYTSEYYW